MNIRLELDNWSLKHEDKGAITLAGSFNVMCGTTKVASQSFNTGYGSHTIRFSPELIARVGTLDSEVLAAVEANYLAPGKDANA